MTSIKEAQRWDTEFGWTPPEGTTLIDGDRKGNNKWFDGKKAGNMILVPGFKIFAVNSDDFIRDIQAALDSVQELEQPAPEPQAEKSPSQAEAPVNQGPDDCNPGPDWPSDQEDWPGDAEPKDPDDEGG